METEDNPQAQLAARRKADRYLYHDTGLSWLLIILFMILMALAVSVFNRGGGGAIVGPTIIPTPTETVEVSAPRLYTVSYKGGVFSPTNLRIHSGDTVRFHNDGIISIRIASDPHPQHNNLVGFDSIGDVPPGSFFTFTFAAKGTFGYHNHNSPDETGTIIVR